MYVPLYLSWNKPTCYFTPCLSSLSFDIRFKGCSHGAIEIAICFSQVMIYRLGTVNSKSFVGKVLLRIKWNFELTVHFKHGMSGK